MVAQKNKAFWASMVILGAVFLVGFASKQDFSGNIVQGSLGGEVLVLEVADTPTLRERGLSGHQPLGPNEGMLFVFPTDSRYGFWMKEMTFPIDSIWLDADYHIVDVWRSADPASYPLVVEPRTPARYAVELTSGFFENHHLQMGNILEIAR